METKHTPGEWESDLTVSDTNILVYNSEGTTLAECFYGEYEEDISKEQAEANAKLIAAAPNLLEASMLAMELIKSISPDHGLVKLLNGTIKKATE